MTIDNEARAFEGEALPWPLLRATVLLRDEFTCAMCGAYATQVDHILARAWGGSDHPLNLQASCTPCNRAKAAWLPTERFDLYAHLSREQTFHLADEMEALIDETSVHYRQIRDLIADRQMAS